MFRLRTQLNHFRFSSVHNQGAVNITWYKLNESELAFNAVSFTHHELNELTYYVANNKINFDKQNYFSASSEQTPSCDLYDLLPINLSIPRNLIIRSTPRIKMTKGDVYNCMEIELLNPNGFSNHHYNLDFDIIGEIEE